MTKPRILIIDDEASICDTCSKILKEQQYEVEACQDGESGLRRIDDFAPDLVLVDLKMPGLSGIDVLHSIRAKDRHIVPIVITGYATVESAVECMKVGAYDFLPKPFTPEQLRMITRRALDWRKAVLETERIRNEKEKLRQSYISMVSHEMRTPLVAVAQYLEVMRNGFAGNISAEQEKVIDRMKIRLDELFKLIDRWLKLARIEDVSFREKFSDVSLPEILADVLDESKDLVDSKKLRVHLDVAVEEGMVKGDPDLIKEVFANIISNGVKYNQEQGEISITLRAQDDYLVVDVSDTGVGISQEDILRVGEEFYRVKSEGTVAGTGIGLAIVKKILEIHEGKLQIESKLNQGSTFSVFLPKIKNQAKE